MSVHEFLFRVEQRRLYNNYSKSDIVRNLCDLPTGSALNFYWNWRKPAPVQNWRGLQAALLPQFQRYDNEFQVQVQILNRRQQPHESFGDYFHVILKLRNQQRYPYLEHQLVDISKHTMRLSLGQMLFLRFDGFGIFCRYSDNSQQLEQPFNTECMK